MEKPKAEPGRKDVQQTKEAAKETSDRKENKNSLLPGTKKEKGNAQKELFETEHKFNFNRDGFYDDAEPIEPAKPDAISKTIFVKAIGVVVALFLIITFLIYYA